MAIFCNFLLIFLYSLCLSPELVVRSSSLPVTTNNTEKTEVIVGLENATNAVSQFISKTDRKMSSCLDATGPSIILRAELYNKGLIDLKNRGIIVRQITEITKENIDYCKQLMKMVDELRHLDGVRGNFAVSDTEYIVITAVLQQQAQQPVSQLIYSNIKGVVEAQQTVFDTLWNKAIPAEQKIKEIEEGIEPEFLNVISDHTKAQDLYIDLAKSIQKEALFLLADSKAMIRADRLGIVDYLIKASSEKGANIKIICPLTKDNSNIIAKMREKAPSIKILDGGSSHSGILLVDNERFLRFELKKPRAEEFSQAIGFVVYSNSKVSIDSTKSFFELLWNERLINEELKIHDKMQNEFINIAAHELRTPIQPILGLSDILSSKIKDSQQLELLDAVIRNAKRLQRLTEDILDVTKIESQTLRLNKQWFNLNEVTSNVVKDYKNQTKNSNRNINLVYEESDDNNNKNEGKKWPPLQQQQQREQEQQQQANDSSSIMLIKADKSRIIQVISNLLSNAVKFTKQDGTITIAIKKKEEDNKYNNNTSMGVVVVENAFVTIKDNGEGIHPDILPRLFTKFASKSYEGTGLGLFISKSIIEAHGGRIWAENNPDGRGATFSFSLPIQ